MTREKANASLFRWFGPGAIIASLTIGAGELIFSARAGALFGYRLLWFFLLVLLLKWVLVLITGRHMILSGAHPFERWSALPGPRGWFCLVFLLLALISFPVWVSFHAGTLGTLLAYLTRTTQPMAYLAWGIAVLLLVTLMALKGGYVFLERIQVLIILLMTLCVTISLILLKPDWIAMLQGLFIPQMPAYPVWENLPPEIRVRPVWVEAVTYVGVLGGSGYDYLAYVSYLREKKWGRSGTEGDINPQTEPAELERNGLKALWIDSTICFAPLLLFTIVFMACGAEILAPAQKVPSGGNLLGLQAQFISPRYSWFQPLYFLGAFLAIFGTLFGTIEVAPQILKECARVLWPGLFRKKEAQFRSVAICWAALGGLMILVVIAVAISQDWISKVPDLIGLITPANLFTGVLACGFICLLSIWADFRFLPRRLQPSPLLLVLNLLGGLLFLFLGLKSYWDYGHWPAIGILAGTLLAGGLLAWAIVRRGQRETLKPE